MEKSNTEFITSHQWDLFAPDEIDLSTTEKEWVEYRDVNVQISSTLSKYEIEMRDKDAFVKPHEGYLEVRYHVVQSDGSTALAAPENTTFQNNALSLFKN